MQQMYRVYFLFQWNLVKSKKIGILTINLYVTIDSVISFGFCFTDFIVSFQVDYSKFREPNKRWGL